MKDYPYQHVREVFLYLIEHHDQPQSVREVAEAIDSPHDYARGILIRLWACFPKVMVRRQYKPQGMHYWARACGATDALVRLECEAREEVPDKRRYSVRASDVLNAVRWRLRGESMSEVPISVMVVVQEIEKLYTDHWERHNATN